MTADFEFSNAQEVLYSLSCCKRNVCLVVSIQSIEFNLFMNDKFFKIGLSDSDKCSFCGTYTEDLYHLFFNCSFVQAFWNVFTVWWSDLSGEYLTLSLKDIMGGLLQGNDLLNYLIILGKLTRSGNVEKITPLQYLDYFCTRFELKNRLKK